MSQHHIYRFDDFLVDPESWSLSRNGNEIHLEPVVLDLLIYLITHRDRLVKRQELMDAVWGNTVISESALSKAVARLRKVLGDDFAAHRYLETVHSRGYRFVADVEEVESPVQPDVPSGNTHAVTVRRALFAGAAAIVGLIVLGVLWTHAPQHDALQNDGIRSLAVLPLSNLTGDPEQDHYVDGLQDLLITEFSRLSRLRVTSRQSTKRYRDSQLPTTDIAGELGVDAIVEGSLLRADSTIEVTMQLIDGRSDEHLWAERYVRETPYVFNLISDIANDIGTEIGATMVSSGVEALNHDRMSPIDARAIDAYALGTMHLDGFTRDGIATAIDQFKKAVAIEPRFALAWAQLGAAHSMLGLYGYVPPRESKEKLRAAVLRAIDADDHVFVGHSGLGWVRWWTGDFDGACESFEEALRLNPSAPYAMHGHADCLMLDGRMDDSLARLRELVAISPFSAMHNMPLPYHLYVARRFDEAISAAKDLQVRVPHFSMHWFFAMVYWQQGRFDQALEEERLQLERHGDAVLLAALEEGLDATGPTGAMRAVAEVLVVRANETYVDPFDIGETFARAGMVDEALHWLHKAVEHGSYKMTYLAYWPHLDILRDDPRYPELAERVYGQRVPEVRRSD